MPAKTAEQTTIETQEPIGAHLVPAVDDATPTAIIDPDDPWQGVDDGDLTGDGAASRLPYIKLNRKMGGGFVDSDTGEAARVLEFYWLARGRSRAQWDRPFDGKASDEDKAPACRSFDGLTSDPTSPGRKSEVCATCPYNRFDGERTTHCHRAVEAMVFIADTTPGGGRLARIRFSGMAETAARVYWDSFKDRLPRRPAIAFLTRATLEEVDTDNGPFLVPRFERVKETSRAEAQPLIDERDRRLDDWKADTADSVRAQRSEDEGAPATGPKAYEPFPPGDYADGEEPLYGENEQPF